MEEVGYRRRIREKLKFETLLFDDLVEAIRIDPGLAPARYNLAVLLIRQGKLADAERELREAIRGAPALDMAYYTLGNLLARQGRFQDALPVFREAVRLRPGEADWRMRLSRVETILAQRPPGGEAGR